MKKRTLFITVLSVVVLIGLAILVGWLINRNKPSASILDKEKITKSEPKAPVQDHILVKFKDKVTNDEKDKIHQKTGGKVKEEIKQIGVQIVEIPKGKGVTPEAFVETYKGNFKNEIDYAEPDYYVEPALVPDDQYYQWGWQGPLQRMGSEAAWDITTGSPSVSIAILDSGLDMNHCDVQGRYVEGYDFYHNDATVDDENGHGTSVFGVMGATTNNGLLIAAVSWHNPVLVVKIAGYDGTTTFGLIAKGIIYAADRGAKAISISFAGPSYPASVATAVDYAWNKGAVTVAAAGNESTDTPQYPAAIPRVVAVGAVTGSDVLWYGSNYGSWIDVVAPYVSDTTCPGAGCRGDCLCAINDCCADLWGGTSISTPFVTGLFGLVFSANPGLTPQQAVDIVSQTATDLGDAGFDDYYGWGKINLYQAVLAASGYTPTTGNISGTVTDSATGANLSSATITLLQADISKGQTTTDSSGNYTLTNLAPGTYDVRAEKINYQTQTQTGKTVSVGQTTTVNFTLTPIVTTGNITGKVTSSTGANLAQATVSAYQSSTLIKSTTTLSDGTYTLSNLNAGSYDLTASLSGYTSQTKTGISVVSGQTTSGINFSLTANPSQQYGSLTGVVTNSSGQIVSGAKVTATLNRTSYSTTTISSGLYTFTNIPVGSYTVKASSKGLSGSGTATIQAGQIATLNLVLKKGK